MYRDGLLGSSTFNKSKCLHNIAFLILVSFYPTTTMTKTLLYAYNYNAAAPAVVVSAFGSSKYAPTRGRTFLPSSFRSAVFCNTSGGSSSSSSSLQMSYVSDSSDYGGGDDTDYEDEGGGTKEQASGPRYREFQDVPAVEAKPVPLSKNSAYRFVALYYDAEVDANPGRTRWERHCLRMNGMQHHVLWARCANMYNETFNNNSMADVVWSYPL
jgi:hypothetical protein